jgi:hypothetical protein
VRAAAANTLMRGGPPESRTRPGACAACVSVPSNAPTVIRRGLDGGCTVAGFARGTLRTQRGEHCRFARPIRLRVACEICGVMAAHKDSDTSYGHGLLLRLVSDCCDRCVAHGGPDARTRPHQAGGPGGAWPVCQRRGSFPVAGGYRPPRPRSLTLRSRRPASKRAQQRTPRLDRLPPCPDRPRAAHPNTDAPHDRAHPRATTARSLSFGDSRELSRQRTNHAAVSSRRLPRRERRRAEQRPNEHHGEYALTRKHHASRRSNW